MKLHDLDILIQQVCPIHGVNSNGQIHFKDEATEEQKALAAQIVQQNIGDVDG